VTAHRDILVVPEIRGEKLAKSGLEILTKARELGDTLGARVEALLLGPAVAALAESTIHHGADIVLTGESEALTLGNVDAHFHAILPVVKERKPEILLFSATPMGLDLAPRLAAALGTGALADATKLEIDETDRLLVAKRLTYDGSIEAVATIPKARPQVASLRPGAVRPGYPDESRYGRVEGVEVVEHRTRVRFLGLEDAPPATPPLETAEVVVSGGLGLGSRDGMKLVDDLARALGGAPGATRAAVQFGLADADRQVGATGRRVKPRLYVAAGLSGQFEHFVGVTSPELVVAINPDKKAPVSKLAQYHLVGDARTLIPAILEELKRE